MTKEIIRCDWCGNDPLYVRYHDREWGVPVHDEHKHFEFLLLESAQAGLSWITILKKRENYRQAFDDFNAEKIAAYNEDKINQLLQNPGIVRNRLKINSAVNNAQCFLEICNDYGSFDNYIWEFTGGKPVVNNFRDVEDLPASTPLSEKISKELRKRGFTFMGPTIVYAHMQATGLVNDHLTSCFRHKQLQGLI